MRSPVPGIIVTLPARGPEEARDEVREAQAAGADLAEVRFDRWEPSDRRRANALFPSPLPLVATLRSRAEGGNGPDDPAERRAILEDLGRLPFRWIDLEDGRDRPEAIALPPPPGLGRIVSTHWPDGTTPERWSEEIRRELPAGAVRKVVARAEVAETLTRLIPALPPPEEARAIALTTGPSAPLLRALSRRLELPFVFASLPERFDQSGLRPPVEPGQIPADRLRPYLEAPDEAPLFAIVGHPVAHSRSPSIHGRWIGRTGRRGLYVPLDVGSEEEFLSSLPLLAGWGFRGLNVTHPWKAAALSAASEVSRGAESCGVANCLTLDRDGLAAENTDLVAILRRLDELKDDGRWSGRSLSVIGGGGAARATLAAAREQGASARLYARSRAIGEAVARSFGAEFVPPSDARVDELVVHATPVGRAGAGPLEVPLAPLVGQGTHVIDWVYAADSPVLHRQTEEQEGTYEDGTRLLVYQAAASFGIWWGEEPAPEEIRRVLKEEECTA